MTKLVSSESLKLHLESQLTKIQIATYMAMSQLQTSLQEFNYTIQEYLIKNHNDEKTINY